METLDTVTEFFFFNGDEFIGSYSEIMTSLILENSANSYGIAYHDAKKDDLFHAKGTYGIHNYDFYWTRYEAKERMVH